MPRETFIVWDNKVPTVVIVTAISRDKEALSLILGCAERVRYDRTVHWRWEVPKGKAWEALRRLGETKQSEEEGVEGDGDDGDGDGGDSGV